MKIDIQEVLSKKDINSFINFPHDLYADDKNYVPELYMAQSEVLSKKKNPFFQHSYASLFLAKDSDGKIVGRISAILNNNYNDYHKCNVGFFGFFDSVNNQEVANALFDRAKEWLVDKKVDSIIGPANFSITTDTGGLLVKGFDEPPIVMMTYNARYYEQLVVNYGFVKEMDLHAFMIYTEKVSEKSLRLAGILEERLKRSDITIRNINMKDFKNEIKTIKKVYDEAWEKNMGFNPATDAEFKHLAEGLKLIINPEWVFIAEDKGKPVGFALSLPDINEITINFKRGKLFPFNIFKLLMNKKKVKKVRIATLGILEDYRKKGIEAIFFAKNIELAKKYNIVGGEASWILDNNKEMMLAAEKLNGELYKTYRMYKYDLK